MIGTGYRLSHKIGEGGISEVYLADDLKSSEKRAIKFLKPSATSKRIEDLIRFRTEASSVSRLAHPNIVRIFEIGEQDETPFLVMEYLEGPSLRDFLERANRITPVEAVDMITQICDALDHIHSAGIVHRDLKPGNILFTTTPTGKRILKLIDFGFARLKDFLAADESGEVVGTFGFMSPEQCGVVKRKVDARSDLYSLGIICYQIFTGALPFEGDSVSSVIHQHIAKVPDHPCSLNSELPQVLGDITLKLLEKEPEKRYQSALGIVNDLKKFRRGKRDFVLGLDEQITALNYRTSLTGREEEFEKLKRLYRSAERGEGSVTLISGEAGRGKTRLAEELRDMVIAGGGLFIDGKCFSGENKTPYGPFRDALNIFIEIFRRYTPEQRNRLKALMSDSLGDLGEVVVRINASMREVLGDPPPMVRLESDREHERFLMTASRFFLGLGTAEHPAVIVLDDLQWTDRGSLDLLGIMLKNIATSATLVVGTYRDNEVDAGHPLRSLITEAGETGRKLVEIPLALFDQPRLNEFIARLLFTKQEDVRTLSDFVFRKSKGNPFFAIEVLKQLVTDGALIHSRGAWEFRSDELAKSEIAGTIIDIIIKRISLLEAREVEVLSYAAAIGRKFSIELLFELAAHIPKDIIVAIVDRCVELQLLERDLQEKGKILFVHDRIREAFYRNIDDNSIRTLHLKIARTLESFHKNAIDAVLFDLAYHYIKSGDPEKSLAYALPAGLRAMEHYANEEALRYLNITAALLDGGPDAGVETLLLCRQKIGEINLRIGRNDEGIAIFNHILTMPMDDSRRAEIYMQLCLAFFNKGAWKECEENARVGLALLGENLPVKNPRFALSLAREIIVHIIRNIVPFRGKAREGGADTENIRRIIWFYLRLNYAYLLGNNKITYFIRSTLRMLHLSESRLGPSRELGMTLAGYASLCMAIPLFARSRRYHEKALELRRKLKDEWGMAQSLQFMGFGAQWSGDAKKGLEYNEQAHNRFMRIGDIWEMAMCQNGFSAGYYYLSDYEKSIQASMNWLDTSIRIRDSFGESTSMANLAWANTELGNHDQARQWAGKGLALSESRNYMFEYCLNATYFGYLNTITGNYHEAIQLLEKARRLDMSTDFLKAYTSILYPYLADAYRLDYLSRRPHLARGVSRAFARKLRKACLQALRKTRQWKLNRPAALRSMAQYCALTGSYRRAERFFLKSIREADATERRFELARSFLEYGEFLASRGLMEAAMSKWTTANRIFVEINARFFARKASDLLGIHGADSSRRASIMERQRLLSIIKLSQDVSSILNINELLDVILSKAVEVTGARRGFLFLRDQLSAELRIAATREIQQHDKDDVFSHSIVNEVYRNDRIVLTTNAARDERMLDYESVAEYGLKSVLAIPIKFHDRLMGVCYLDNPLSSGVFTDEDADLLRVFMSQAAIAIENAQLYQNLEKKVEERTRELSSAYSKLDRAYSIIKDDLSHARIIHETIFPRNLESLGGFDFTIVYHPAIDIGGDLYDITALEDGAIRVFLADAIGHGVQAALATMLIKSEYEKVKKLPLSPDAIIDILNGEFIQIYRPSVSFFTCVIFDIDRERKTLTFATAGHPEQYLLTKNSCAELRSPGRAIGLHAQTNCAARSLPFNDDYRLLLFTDGFTEQFSESGEIFGEERLKGCIMANIGKPVKDIIQAAMETLSSHSGRAEANDDITVIGIEGKG